VRLSDSPFETSAAPLMGAHTEDVLTSIAGYTAEEVRQLRDNGVI
jgi:crotonobetainyl-CoA:carnitine CoA-transferase CaiB-like acyl-CoA transferase